MDGKVSWFDYCESETWSPLWFDDFIEQLGYERTESMRIYWQLPGKDVADGLRVISNDSDTNVMVSVVDRVKNLVVYFDHDDNIAGLDFDDIVVNPVAELPKVLSPHKVQYVPKKVDEKLPNFYSDVPTTSRGMVDDEGSDSSGGDDGSSEDSDFVDSDYEIDADDDDLFVKNVDVGVNDEGAAVNASSSQGADDDICIDEDCLDLPDSEDEGEVRLRFKSWSAEDFSNPVFKPGMVFPSVEVLRKAITEYSLKNRVQIKMPRNDITRIEAHCAPGCPWRLYASHDSRAKCFMVKTYQSEYNCQKEFVLQRCTSKWLAEKYIEVFRSNDKLSLANFAKVVQREWNLTPTRTKLARARLIALKKVHGDEEEQYNQLWDYGQELRRSNPGTSFYLNIVSNHFSTCYFSLDASKRGFLSACRPLICLDGCHIKTRTGGILLTAVGIDPNDCIYPIAMAMVEVECKDSWLWFLNTLKSDLGIESTYPWTVMTDKQKVIS